MIDIPSTVGLSAAGVFYEIVRLRYNEGLNSVDFWLPNIGGYIWSSIY